MTSRFAAFAVVASIALVAATETFAQSVGAERVGTSAGNFLKIGVGARAVGMGESFVAVANDPSTIYWNPAGLGSIIRREGGVSFVRWPADISYGHVSYVAPVNKLGGSLGFQLGVLSTEIEETTEFRPFGTGVKFTYADWFAGATYGKRLTDRLLVGVGAKFVHEDLGADVGGTYINSWLVDIGSIYYLGISSVRIGMCLAHFGPDFNPSGEYTSATGEERDYDSFSPPTTFRFGVAWEPIEREGQRLTTAVEFNQPSDNELTGKFGAEYEFKRRFAVRTGYNMNADELKWSAGAGLYPEFGTVRGTFDYAFTDGGFLGSVHRVSLGVRF
ncbi:MAG: PorV/PorQ family protein [Candidatus Eiseniibacteriota bacterium]